MSSSSVVAAWTAAVANVLLAFVAAFQDTIRRALHHPLIQLEMTSVRPDCQKITMPGLNGQAVDCYWFRIRAWNRGGASAQDVEVYAANLEERRDNHYSTCAWFLPMRLVWSHTGRPLAKHIAPNTYKHCEIGRIVDPQSRNLVIDDLPDTPREDCCLRLFTEAVPVNRRHVLYSGQYRLTLVVSGRDVPAESWTAHITIPHGWEPDEQRMLGRGLVTVSPALR